MEQYRDYVSLIGRMCMAGIFLLSGIGKILDPQGTQQYMASMGMTTATGFFYVAAVAIEVGCGLSLLLGYMTRVGAMVLFLFMIPTTLIFHTNFSDPMQMIHFLKNLAMGGGLLYIAAYGPGRLSMDGRVGLTIVEETIVMRPSEQRRFGETGS